MLSKPLGLLALAASLLLPAGCGNSPSPPVRDEPPGISAQQLPVGDYVADGLPAPYREGDALRLTIKEGSISFAATCNTFSGNLTQSGRRLVVTDIGGTEMACEQPREDQDRWLTDFFAREPTVTVDGNDIRLRAGSDEIALSPVEGQEDRPIDPAGKDWVLSGIEETDGDSVGIVVVDSHPPLRLDGERLTFNTGCNDGGAQVKANGAEWQVSAVVTTRKACRGAAAEVERMFLQVMQDGTLRVDATDGSLRISAVGKRGRTLVYVSADATP